MSIFQPDDLAEWTGGRWTLLPSATVTGVCHDTRDLRPGEIYVAIRGERFDGHEFIARAFEEGAAAALVEDGFHPPCDLPLLLVEDTRRALGDMARGHRARLTGSICGITGSVGKTTVKEMLAGIASQAGATSATRGNWNNDIGLPLSMLSMEPSDRFGVFEIAMNRPGEIAQLTDLLRPQYGVMTTVGMAHSEYFASVEAIAHEKASMLRALPNDGFAVLACDEEWFDLFARSTRARVCTVAIGGHADYRGELDAEGHILNIEGPNAKIDFRLPVPGHATARNALLAVATALELGIAADTVMDGIARFKPLPMRWNESSVGGVLFVNDAYNANPVSMRSALETFFRMKCAGRRWAVLGGMRELGGDSESAHLELGSIVSQRADVLIAVGECRDMIARGARAEGMVSQNVFECESCRDAAAILDERAEAGDAVLLKASRAARLERVLEQFASRRRDSKDKRE